MPSPACTDTAAAGKVLSGVEVASTIRSIDCASTWALASAALRRLDGEIGRHLAVRRDMALADAGALHDPFVGGVDAGRELLVGEDALRQIAAASENDRTQHAHEAAPPMARSAALTPAWRWMVSPILASSS